MVWIHLKTLFSFHFYHRLILTTRWQVVGFVVYLWLLSVLVFYGFANGLVKKNLSVFLKNFPEVTFEKGVLTAPKDTVFVPLPGSDFKIAFDATRQTPPSSEELIRENILALVSSNTVYMPGSGHAQQRTLPPTLTVTTTQEFLNTHADFLVASLTATILMAACFLIPFVMLFDFFLALSVITFFSLWTRRLLPRHITLRWAVFLQGPLAILWYARLWYDIPLFMWAQVFLCIIYVQQIFNLIPENNKCA